MLAYLILQKSFCSYRHYERNLWLRYLVVCSVIWATYHPTTALLMNISTLILTALIGWVTSV